MNNSKYNILLEKLNNEMVNKSVLNIVKSLKDNFTYLLDNDQNDVILNGIDTIIKLYGDINIDEGNQKQNNIKQEKAKKYVQKALEVHLFIVQNNNKYATEVLLNANAIIKNISINGAIRIFENSKQEFNAMYSNLILTDESIIKHEREILKVVDLVNKQPNVEKCIRIYELAINKVPYERIKILDEISSDLAFNFITDLLLNKKIQFETDENIKLNEITILVEKYYKYVESYTDLNAKNKLIEEYNSIFDSIRNYSNYDIPLELRFLSSKRIKER